MKEQYNWDYLIKIKTKDGTFEFEKESLEHLEELINQYPEYEEFEAKKMIKIKKKEQQKNKN